MSETVGNSNVIANDPEPRTRIFVLYLIDNTGDYADTRYVEATSKVAALLHIAKTEGWTCQVATTKDLRAALKSGVTVETAS